MPKRVTDQRQRTDEIQHNLQPFRDAANHRLDVACVANVDGSRVDRVEAMARGNGPKHATVALGCAGWGAGQLENELVENSWLTAPVAPDVLYALPLEARWQAAAGLIGVDMARIADYAGHA